MLQYLLNLFSWLLDHPIVLIIIGGCLLTLILFEIRKLIILTISNKDKN